MRQNMINYSPVIKMKQQMKGTLALLLGTFVWGMAFIAQSVGMELIGPFTFQAIRCLLGVLFLFPASLLLDCKIGMAASLKKWKSKKLWRGGIICGAALFAATSLQQVGLVYTAPGKAGFLTAMYIVLVPILGLFLRKKVTAAVWISVVLAAVGLYFLCMNEALTIEKSDLMVMLCSLAFAVHILVIDHFTQKVNGVALSTAQFAVAAIVSGIGAVLTETPTLSGITECILPLLYVGVMSGGVGYTLQILAQKDANPTVVSLLLSLESVFSVLAGALILHDRLTGRELLGCALMLLAVVLAQLPARGKVAEAAKN